MAYLLDTDVLRYYLDDVSDAVALVAALIPDGISISIVTYMELYQGTLQTRDPSQAQKQLMGLLDAIPTLPLSPAVARRCAHLREDLKRAGKRVRQRALDLLIAATALEHGLVLVTRNREDFNDIPSLQTLFYPPLVSGSDGLEHAPKTLPESGDTPREMH
jgi:predicted nucleic acid-binding protein